MLASYVLFHRRVNHLVPPCVEYPKNNELFIIKKSTNYPLSIVVHPLWYQIYNSGIILIFVGLHWMFESSFTVLKTKLRKKLVG
jgi:hypothetical protein